VALPAASAGSGTGGAAGGTMTTPLVGEWPGAAPDWPGVAAVVLAVWPGAAPECPGLVALVAEEWPGAAALCP
jgi:hypothetical protein